MSCVQKQQMTKRTTVNNIVTEEVVHVNFVAAVPLILTIVAMGDHNCHMYVCTLYWKKYHSFAASAALIVLHTRNNTNNKLKIYQILRIFGRLSVSLHVHNWNVNIFNSLLLNESLDDRIMCPVT